MIKAGVAVVAVAVFVLVAACSGDDDGSRGGTADASAPAAAKGRGCTATATGCTCSTDGPPNDTPCYVHDIDTEICCQSHDRTTCACGPKQEVPIKCYLDRSGGCSCGRGQDGDSPPPGNTPVDKCTPAPVPPGQQFSCSSDPYGCQCRTDGKVLAGDTQVAACPQPGRKYYGCRKLGDFETKACDGACSPEWCKGYAGESCDVNGCSKLEFACQNVGGPGEKCGTIRAY